MRDPKIFFKKKEEDKTKDKLKFVLSIDQSKLLCRIHKLKQTILEI